jgi:hypothetical protein
MLIAINPTNPLNVVGFSHRLTSPITLDVYRSTDGGATWSTTQITSANDGLPAQGNRYDPALAFDANGVLYIAYGVRGTAGTPGTPATPSQLVAAVSTDGGQKFTNFSVIDTQNDPNGPGTKPPGVDRWTMTTGRIAGTENQSAVIAYTQSGLEDSNLDQRIVVVGTNNAGNTWTAPLVINDASNSGTDAGNLSACPAIGYDGDLHVTCGTVTSRFSSIMTAMGYLPTTSTSAPRPPSAPTRGWSTSAIHPPRPARRRNRSAGLR